MSKPLTPERIGALVEELVDGGRHFRDIEAELCDGLRTLRNAILDDAIGEVIEQQMTDANRLITEEEGRKQGGHGACSALCDGVTCHSLEAHAAHNRTMQRLRALKGGS